MIPKDPMILLSYVNTQLRDYYDSLEALCTLRGIKKEELIEKLDMIDYHYDEELFWTEDDSHSYNIYIYHNNSFYPAKVAPCY